MRAYVKALSKYQTDLERLGDTESLDQLANIRERLEEMLVALGRDKSGKVITSAS